jgi:hypothetical protein
VARSRRSSEVLTLRVELAGTSPLVWRRVLVNASSTFEDLHDVLQLAMGWEDYHLHAFRVGDLRIGIADDDDDDEAPLTDEASVSLGDVVGVGGRFVYEYDFGDCWEHDVEVEASDEVPRALERPVCVGGERACPLEDSGGVAGYEEFLLVLSDPDHNRHAEFVRRANGFDPAAFSLATVNASLQHPR